MKRLTKKEKDNYTYDNIDEIVLKLGTIEDLLEELLLEQTRISKELENLRKQGQIKTYKFRELLSQKFINQTIISKMESNNLI